MKGFWKFFKVGGNSSVTRHATFWVLLRRRATRKPRRPRRNPLLKSPRFIRLRLWWWCSPRYYIGRMSTAQTWQTVSTSLESTARLAEALGARLRGGEVIELVSDVGGGKTTFVRSLAKGMGSLDKVGSPTFTISRQYQAGDLTLHHFDFYRLVEPGLMASELVEIVDDPKAVIAIEWANIVDNVLPAERLTIGIIATGENERTFTFLYPENMSYLAGNNT
jgi:tRNA threonylcarbamoyladenosine biosynthesis protein TsaE